MTSHDAESSLVWDQYGRAMAAVLHLELSIRVANATTALVGIERSGTSTGNKEAAKAKIIANAMAGTFGPIVDRFIRQHSDRLGDVASKWLHGAIEIRNILAHHFLSCFYYGIYSTSGQAEVLTVLEEWTETLDQLDRLVREISPIDTEGMRDAAEQARQETGPPPIGTWPFA